MLEVEHVSLGIGDLRILDRVSLSVKQGDLVGLVGPNGAGKSTLFAIISGFLSATAGEVRFDGRNVTRLSVSARAQLGLVRTFQVPREFPTLTVRENFAVSIPRQRGESIGQLFLSRKAVAAETVEISRRVGDAIDGCGLTSVADLAAAKLSGGQKKLLELGRATMLSPRLLLLDEPFNGVNPAMIARLSDVILDLNRRGTTLIVVEHNLTALAKLTKTIHVMDRGAMIASGEAADVFQDRRVREAYLGAGRMRHA